jgi:starvation-inducible DNA-binding protein
MDANSEISGRSAKDQEDWQLAIARGIAFLLADTCSLYMKTQGFHWNVHGEQFRALHLLFEEQYSEMLSAMDTLAERIRTLGLFAPGSLTEMSALSRISQQRGVPGAKEMLRELIRDHADVVTRIRELRSAMVEAGDEASIVLLDSRLGSHEKMKWMLEASSDEQADQAIPSVLDSYS